MDKLNPKLKNILFWLLVIALLMFFASLSVPYPDIVYQEYNAKGYDAETMEYVGDSSVVINGRYKDYLILSDEVDFIVEVEAFHGNVEASGMLYELQDGVYYTAFSCYDTTSSTYLTGFLAFREDYSEVVIDMHNVIYAASTNPDTDLQKLIEEFGDMGF